ncbi:OSCP, subunit 5 of the stator stalk of mitochondrial F1F0 ATP synthase [Suillus paluster]|uniref:OSCP, subunit 5 of the stator stalk of mitochondrial F1F0 ATP synthase n=1 Tax=Suillus paluster TaxID=48578 RepID=UPI001B86C98B|nr:OSCP, subunit 5 of the stator stalk of mitochondrial F1F0 ATP synthase [Suillus paluster]KAG1733057.1 OSCP, subunit 5 of the stator stalk of mitochondrial F1F0 ATP synthase [Suillus paluster]
MLCSSFRSATASVGLGRRAASTIAQKYSKAVYSAALSKSPQTLTKVQLELNAISNTIKEVPDLKAFVSNPTLSAKDRSAGLAVVYAHAESTGLKKEPVSDITKNLFGVLSENGRLGETQGVIEGFNELVAKYKGELEVVVTSATPLPKDLSSRLETILKQSQTAQQAKSLKITNKVNPSVLGGIVVDFGDKSIDLSVSSRVNKLNNVLQRMFYLFLLVWWLISCTESV